MKTLLLALGILLTCQVWAENGPRVYVGTTDSQTPCQVEILSQSRSRLQIRFTVNPGTSEEQSAVRDLRSDFAKNSYSAQETQPEPPKGFLTLISKVQFQNDSQNIRAQLRAIDSRSNIFIFDTIISDESVICTASLR